MANFDKYFPTLLSHEGGFVNNKKDRGGATNLGVTFAVWLEEGYDKDGDGDIDIEDLKKITPEDAKKIAKRNYWDKVSADKINSQSIAEFLFDWAYTSGYKKASKKLQEVLGLTQDGIIGNNTLSKLNSSDFKEVFNKLKASREQFFRAIVRADKSQEVFLKGWLNRNNSFKFIS